MMWSRSHSPETRGARKESRWRLALALAGYNLLLVPLLPVLAGWLLWRLAVRRKVLGCWRHRLGLTPRLARGGGPRVWLHAVSAGEMAAVRPVLDALRASLPDGHFAISTVTPAGMAVGRRGCQGADAFFYLPFDLCPSMAAAVCRLRPGLVVVTEKELWPNFLGLARLAGAAVLVVNGRVSDRMMGRASWAGGVVRWLYGLPHHFCVQSRQDASRLTQLGVPPARVTIAGNTKVDSMSVRDTEAEARLASSLGINGEAQWLVAGSTHPGEEEVVVEAFLRIREAIPGARLLIAPRHLERVAAVSAMLAQRGLSVALRSDAAAGAEEAVVVLDTMGELRAAYGLAAAAFVGGTLVPVGGHNLLEPVAAGRAVLFGPHTENCADVADLVLQAGVGFRVSDAEELVQQFIDLVRDTGHQDRIASYGRALIEQQRGAAQRCAAVARALLEARAA